MVLKSPKAKASPVVPAQRPSAFEAYFEIARRGSTVPKEIRGGLVTFFSMAYIIALNPLIVGTVADANGNLVSGLPASDPVNVGLTIGMVAAATALVAGVLTAAMGLIGRFPVALATGLGLNSVVAYSLAPTMTWPQVMGLIVWEGVLITILVLTGFRKAVFSAVPKPLRTAISVGIGLFICLVGLADAGFVRPGGALVTMGVGGNLLGWPLLVFVVGLGVLVVLFVKRVKGAMLITIAGATILSILVELLVKTGGKADGHDTGWMLNVPAWSADAWGWPDLELLRFWDHVDLVGAFSGGPKVWITLVLTILALMLADFFDSMGTIVAVGQSGGLLKSNGNPPRTQEILLVDSVAAIAGGLFSTSSNTSYIESAAGVEDGARTGLANLVTGLCFILAVFISPIIKLVPSEAVAPVLVLVGFLMLRQVSEIDWADPEVALPAFFMVTLMAFTYSITVGIGVGFLAYLLIKTVRRKWGQVHPLLWVVGGLFLVYFAQGVILEWVA
ncbi:MAG: NCS2 family permease [Propionibacteriaceae bacterium]|jgi:AGZA family xanthine/uracil permease-like MFS transporter|nr:NCS2 family permease [Propionibacteriaceae bacterium]